jgi:cytochrome P450
MSQPNPAGSQAAPQPSHVPESLVCDFDLFADPALLADPHARVAELIRTAPPIFWTPRNGGHWVALSHEANFDAARDWETFSNEYKPLRGQSGTSTFARSAGGPHVPLPVPMNVDPPEHGKFRLPLNAVFSPKAMNGLKDDIRALARKLIGAVKPEGGCEFMSTVAEPLPVEVFLKLFGLPVERQKEYRALVREHMAHSATTPAETIAKLQRVAAIMRDTFEDRRDNPKDDVISLLWRTEIDGRATTMEDMENYGVLLFLAGLDTVMNGMGLGVRHLASDAALQQRLRDHPEVAGDVTEELLRRYTFTVPPRFLAKDTVFHDVAMKQGEKLHLFLPAADLDPKRFENPERFDAQREDKVHIAFGAGPHRCLGSHLARIELQIVYEELAAGLPPFRLDPAKPPKFHGTHVIGLDTLNLVWDA